jgi:spore photoproduct lyase
VAEVKVPGASMAEKINNGKHVLVIDKRSGSLLDKFVNHDPGSVCPSFPKLLLGTSCPFNCSYCFLQATYRAVRPFVCFYVVDVQKLEKDVRRTFADTHRPVVISAGEMSDPLVDCLGYVPRIVEMFGRINNVRLLLLTKSGIQEIQPLLNVDHNGHTITSWSITCQEIIERHEIGNVPLNSRLDAAKLAQDAGFEVRFRLDPMLMFQNWEEAYGRTIDSIYAKGIHPSRFTLGSFRLLGNLRGIIKARFPESDILQQPLVNEGGKRQRYPHDIREAFYRHAIEKIREHDNQTAIALCKETPNTHRSLEGLIDTTKCNCLP